METDVSFIFNFLWDIVECFSTEKYTSYPDFEYSIHNEYTVYMSVYTQDNANQLIF